MRDEISRCKIREKMKEEEEAFKAAVQKERVEDLNEALKMKDDALRRLEEECMRKEEENKRKEEIWRKEKTQLEEDAKRMRKEEK